MKTYLVVGTYGGVSIKYACTDPNRAFIMQQRAKREIARTGLPLHVVDAMCSAITIVPIEVDINPFYPLAGYPETTLDIAKED